MLAHVVDQHAEQVAALWTLRAKATTSPRHTLRALAELDARIEAHLDGLRVAGRAGWDACRRELASGEEGEVFAAAVQAFESNDPSRTDEVLEIATSPSFERAVISALGWLPYARVAPIIARFSLTSPMVRRLVVAASAVHRRDPGASLDRALFDEDARVRGRALRAAGELGRVDLLPLIIESMHSEKGACRYDAAWSAALLGARNATTVLREAVEIGGEHVERALAVAVRCMFGDEARAWLEDLARDPTRRRLAVIGAGTLGDPTLVSWLIEMANAPETARAAGRSFAMIMGVDLVGARLARRLQHHEYDAIDETDPTVLPASDRLLPLPDTEALIAYWADHGADFLRGARYLRGKPTAEKYLREALLDGRQPERAVAAMEMTVRRRGTPLFEVRAPGFRQLATEPLSNAGRTASMTPIAR